MSDEVVTYDEVARWLRRQIRESIESASPCPSNGGPHDFDHLKIDVTRMDGGGGIIEHWRCVDCGCDVSTDPDKPNA